MKFLPVLLLTFLAASSCSRPAVVQRAEAASTELPVMPVAAVTRENLATSAVLTAEFEPFQEIEVMAKISGYVQSIKVDIGDRVREGQLIAVLEVPEMQDDLSRADATVQQAEAEVSAAKDELNRSESAHHVAHLSFTRMQEVAKREPGLVPLQDVDEIQSKDLISEAQISAARSKLRAAEQRIHVTRAEESRVRTMQKYVSITAPFAGMITRRYANTGAMVQAGTASQSQAMPLVRLSQDGVLRLRLPVPESMVTAVRLGGPVEVRVNSLNRTFAGKVARTTGKVDQSTRTLITEVDVANPSGVILPGMYAEVKLQLASHQDVLAIPLEAVDRASSATRVYRVDPQGAIRITPVHLGIEDSRHAEIISGLGEGDHVVLGKRAGLKEGDRVRVKLGSEGSAN